MGDFRKLEAWQIAKKLAVVIYRVTNENAFSKDFGLRDQIRRAVISISSNIAEGEESGTNKMSIRFFNIAKGSAAEVQSQAEIAFEIGYLNEETLNEILTYCNQISSKLSKLITYRRNHLTKPQP
jgi:four helix bundle protein